MKILMTGFTALQINSENRSIQKIDVPGFVVKALKELGHEVDWRRVQVGEDLSGYDMAWVNLAPLHSLNGRQGAMGSLYTLSSGIPCVGFFDDWQFSAVFNGAKALVRRPAILYKHLLTGAEHRGGEGATYFSRADVEAALERVRTRDPEAGRKVSIERYYMLDKDEIIQPYEKQLVQAAEDLLNARWEAGMTPVCPMYSFGDRTGVRKRMPSKVGPIEALDPSAVVQETLDAVFPLSPVGKIKGWVLGALMPHDTWLEKKKPSWPVEIVGSRKLIRKMGGQRFNTEQEVLEFYNKYWGIMSPPYMHAGSGWWRSRFIYAAHVGSVLVTDKGEGDALGDAYKLTIDEIEKMDTAQLQAAAQAQRHALFPHLGSYDDFKGHVARIVYRTMTTDQGLKVDKNGQH